MPGLNNPEQGGFEAIYEASQQELIIADIAAELTAEVPGIAYEALSIIETEQSLDEKYTKLIELSNKAWLIEEYYRDFKMEPEEVSPWVPVHTVTPTSNGPWEAVRALSIGVAVRINEGLEWFDHQSTNYKFVAGLGMAAGLTGGVEMLGEIVTNTDPTTTGIIFAIGGLAAIGYAEIRLRKD